MLRYQETLLLVKNLNCIFMVLLSQYSAQEYLLSLRTNRYEPLSQNTLFIETLKSNFRTIKITSVVSIKRNVIFEFNLGDTYYVLKHFFNKNELSKRSLLEEDNFEQTSFSHFNTEKGIFQTQSTFIPTLHFCDNQSKMIIMEKLFGYQEFYFLFNDVLSKDSLRKYYLQNLASLLLNFSKINTNSSLQYNSKNIITVGELKNQDIVWEYYKKYSSAWNGDSIIHGDLFSRNILINKKTRDIKIIDWEMSTIGDIYFDLSIVVSILCDCRLGTSFINVFYPIKDRAYDYAMLKKDINYFLDSYGTIDREKLKTFLIINTQHLSNNVVNLVNNINQIFS